MICCHSFWISDSAGAGYFKELNMVVCMARRAFCGLTWCVLTFSAHFVTLSLRYVICALYDPFGARNTPSVSFASVGGTS